MRLEWITRHEKENYTLGRFSPAFFPCAGASGPVRSWAARLRKGLYCPFTASRPSSGQEYGASLQNAIQGKIKAQAAQKTLYIDNYILQCYALGNYKPLKGF